MCRLCDQAAKLGLKIGMETDSNMLPTAKIGVAILDRIDRPDMLGFNYDPGNVVYYTGADPIEDIQFALPRMVHFHFKDKIGGQGVFNFPPPGDGELDMASAGHCERPATPARSAPKSSSTTRAGPTTTAASPPPNAP